MPALTRRNRAINARQRWRPPRLVIFPIARHRDRTMQRKRSRDRAGPFLEPQVRWAADVRIRAAGHAATQLRREGPPRGLVGMTCVGTRVVILRDPAATSVDALAIRDRGKVLP